MGEAEVAKVKTLADQLLACYTESLSNWLLTYRVQLTFALLEELKRRSDACLLSDPPSADAITLSILLVAQAIPQEPLAMPFACWARGNWAVYHDPKTALLLYQQALTGYQQTQQVQIIVRLLSNLVFAALQCGEFALANAAYARSVPLFDQLPFTEQHFLVPLNLNYGLLLHYEGDFQAALACYDRTQALAHQHQQLDVVVDVEVNRALTLAMMGHLPTAEALLLQSLPIAMDYGQWLTVARIHMNLGELYVAQGRPAEALRSLQLARTQFDNLGNQMEIGSVRLREAELLAQIGAVPEARRSYYQALTQFTELQMTPEIGKALFQTAIANRRYGAYGEAARLLAEVTQLWATLDQPIWQSLIVQERIALVLSQGDIAAGLALLEQTIDLTTTPALAAQRALLAAQAYAQQWQTTGQATWQTTARQSFAHVLAYAQEQGDRWLQRQALVGLGFLGLREQQAEGRAFLEQALALDEAMRLALSVEELKASFLHQQDDLLPLLIVDAIQTAQPWQALRYLWHAKGAALLDLLLARPIPDGSLSPAELAVNTALERVRQELAHHRWQALQTPPGTLPALMPEPASPKIQQLEQQLSQLRRQRNYSHCQPTGLLDEPARLAANLNTDVLLEYIICHDQLFVIRVDRLPAIGASTAQVRCQPIALGAVEPVLDLLDELHLTLQNALLQTTAQRMASLTWSLPECRAILQRCYTTLIAPLQPLPPAARLLIAPCDLLHLFPFAAFWDGEHYLVEHFDLELTPTAALAALPAQPVATSAPLVIAASAEGKLAAIQAEVAAIQTAWPAAVCQIDDHCSLAYLRQLVMPPAILHIASHTVLREDTPLFSAFQLAGGLLSVEQCYDLPLQGVALVTLSSCKTASGMETGGALLALQSAFFVAGAQHVLSSLWPIADQTTAHWMQHFYATLATGVTPPTTLRRTQLALLADPAFCHPAQWAAFACYRR